MYLQILILEALGKPTLWDTELKWNNKCGMELDEKHDEDTHYINRARNGYHWNTCMGMKISWQVAKTKVKFLSK